MPIHDFKSQRLFLEFPLSSREEIELDRNQANYLISVLRMKTGGKLLVFNGADGEWLAELEITGRKAGRLKLIEQTREQPRTNDLVYCFAPIKQGRLDYLIQKAVEMGVGVLQPVMTSYTNTPKLKLDRLRANAIEAAEQCGILSIPQINEIVTLEVLINKWPSDRALIFADEAAREKSPIDCLSKLQNKPLALLVGPEGGFSPEERERLLQHTNTTAINLGPRILRADTAAVAALAVIQASCGDW